MSPRRTLSPGEFRRAAKSIAPFFHAFDLLQEHVIITDANAHILYANSAAEHATGFSLRQMLGKNPADLWGGHMSGDFYRRMWKRLKREKMPFSGEVRNIRKDGKEIWQELHISPVEDPRGTISFYIAVESVITKRKKHEDARETIHALIGTEALSPLTAVRWSLEHLLSGQKLSKTRRKELESIFAESGKAVDAFRDLALFSRLGKEYPREENMDVAEEWRESQQALQEEYPNVSLALSGHARIRSIRSLVREFLFLFTESVSRAARSGHLNLRCVLSKRGKHARLVFSVSLAALRKKDAIDLSIPRIIARYLHWKGPVERKKGDTLQWVTDTSSV